MAILDAQSFGQFPSGAGKTQFDQQATWDATNLASLGMTDGPFGGKTWAAERDNYYLRCDGQWGLSTICVAFWWREYYGNSPRAQYRNIMEFREGTLGSGTEHVRIMTTPFGLVYATRAGTNLGTGFQASRLLPYGKWTHIGIKVLISDTVGTVDVEFNGENVISLSGQDTRNGGTSGIIDYIQTEGEYQYNYRIAEPIVFSTAGDSPTDLFGMHRVHMTSPDADTSVQFTPLGAGSNYAEVDETEWDDDTSHNESSTVTNKDKLGMASLPTQVVTVYSVQAKIRAKDPDGTATESVKVGLDSGTESLSSGQALTTGELMYEGPMETVDPNTSSAWTEANVNAADLVVEHA